MPLGTKYPDALAPQRRRRFWQFMAVWLCDGWLSCSGEALAKGQCASPGTYRFTYGASQIGLKVGHLGVFGVVPATGLEPVQCYLLEPESS